jgi:hypothetical protein
MGSKKNETHGMLNTEYGNQVGQTAEDRAYRSQSRKALLPQAQSYQNSGYSPDYMARLKEVTANNGLSDASKGAITQETLGDVGNVYSAARDNAGLRLARTRNSAGYAAYGSELARQEAQDKASQTRQNMVGFEDIARNRSVENLGFMQQPENEMERRKEFGTGVLSDVYGKDVGGYEAGRDQAGRLLDAKSRLAGTPGILRDIIGGAAQVGGAYLGGR